MKKIGLLMAIAAITGIISTFSFAVAEDTKMNPETPVVKSKAPVSMDIAIAMAEIIDTKGKKIGIASFIPGGKGVRIAVQVTGLTPGKHGIHIHEFGKCDPPDFKSAGGHFNPIKHKHGLDNPMGYHNGDMQNINIDKDGTGSTVIENNMVSLGTSENSLLKSGGTAIVIHAKADDQKTDPSGKSGDRVYCGIITALK